MKKKNITTLILVILFLVGLSLLLYPTISDYWNSFHQSKAITGYVESVASLSDEEYEALWNQAFEYNQTLLTRKNEYVLTDELKAKYESVLDITGQGVIGYIEIPSINCSLSVYAGTSDSVLQRAIGHLDWTSLPVGGESSHCVLSGHRGLPSAKLFTDLDDLVVGDTFMLNVLDETLTYEVDQILIVEPGDTEALRIVKGKDYCTLVTCTPYAVNTHRLLVRGHRVETVDTPTAARVTADATQIDPYVIAPIVATPMLLLLLIVLLIPHRSKKIIGGEDDEDE